MAGTGRRYAPEFKARMVELVRAGRSPDRLANEFEPDAINLSVFFIPHGNHPPFPIQHPINETGDSLLGTQSRPGRCSGRRWRRVPLRATVSPMKIRHKGLRALHERDDRARLTPSLVPRLRRILFRLQEATHPRSADAPGFLLHR